MPHICLDGVNIKEALKRFHRASPFKGTQLLESSDVSPEPVEERPEEDEEDRGSSVSSSAGAVPQIHSSLINKNTNYMQKVFELKRDAGDYQPTTFETLRTEQFMQTPPGEVLAAEFVPTQQLPNNAAVEGELQEVFRRACLAEVRATGEPVQTDVCGPEEEDPSPHMLHESELLASKNIWGRSPRMVRLIADQTLLFRSHRPGASRFLDVKCPLLRKLLIGICSAKEASIELQHAVSAVGYLCAPHIIYGATSTAAIDGKDGTLPLNTILSTDILTSMAQTAVSVLTCGFEHCTALTVSGALASWGYGGSGCLGHGNYVSYTSPKVVKGLPTNIVYVESGAYHTAAISSSGDLFVWGRGDVGQLGVPTEKLSRDNMGWVALVPIEAETLKGEVRRVSAGEAHTLVLDRKGIAYTAGWGKHGQLGRPQTETSFELSPVAPLARRQIVAIGAGSLFSAAVDSEGRLFTWGNGELGQLGVKLNPLGGGEGELESRVPVEVYLGQETALEVVCGESNMLVYCKSGRIFGWGRGVSGDGTTARQVYKRSPEQIRSADSVQCYGINLIAKEPAAVAAIAAGAPASRDKAATATESVETKREEKITYDDV